MAKDDGRLRHEQERPDDAIELVLASPQPVDQFRIGMLGRVQRCPNPLIALFEDVRWPFTAWRIARHVRRRFQAVELPNEVPHDFQCRWPAELL